MTLTREQQDEILALGDAAYAASQVPDDGLPVDHATISMPNLAKSKVIHVRVSDLDHEQLKALAVAHGVKVSDVVRTAVFRYLRTSQETAMMADVLNALRDAGLGVVRLTDET